MFTRFVVCLCTRHPELTVLVNVGKLYRLEYPLGNQLDNSLIFQHVASFRAKLPAVLGVSTEWGDRSRYF